MSNDAAQGAGAGAAQGAKTGGEIGGPWGALVGGVAGGLVGFGLGDGVGSAKTAYQNELNKYLEQVSNLDMPKYADLKLALQRYSNGEPLTNDQLTALQEVDSEVSKITQDKATKQTQLQALAQMKLRARGGLTLQDKADLLNAQKEIDRSSVGAQKSIMQNMAARGQAGSGAELAARMAANQAQVSQTSQNALNIAARAQGNAMQSLKDSASIGRQIGQDQLDFDTLKAKSVDDTRRRNLERLQASMQYNIGNNNTTKLGNYNRANKVADSNTGIANQEQIANKDLLVSDYNRNLNRLSGIYNLKEGQAAGRVKDAQDTLAGTIGAIGSIGSAVGSMGGSSDKKTTNTYGIRNTEDDEDKVPGGGLAGSGDYGSYV